MLSRRTLITAGATAGAASLIVSALTKTAAGQTGCAQSARLADYIAVTPHSDPSFTSKLNRHFPGLLNDPIFQKIQSHAVLISNVSKEEISAFSTHWRATTSTGGYEATIRHFFHPTDKRHKSAKFGLKGNKTRFTGKIPMLKAGATRLVTPYFNWSSNHHKKHPHKRWEKIFAEKESRKFFLYELSNSIDVQVSVDAVIINQKTLIGQDNANLGKTFMITRNAEHDEALETLRLIASGASHEQVKTLLESHISSTLPARNRPFHRLYSRVRQRHAKVLLRRLQHSKPGQFLHTLKYLKRKPKTMTVKVVSTQS